MSESSEQQALISWSGTRLSIMPELRYLAAIPNGGFRAKATGARLKREGAKPGLPDLALFVARRGWHALFIELKTERGRVSVDQKRWHAFLRDQGFFVEVSRSWEGAAKLIEWYLNCPMEQRTKFFE